MRIRALFALIISAASCACATAGDTYSIHENVHVGQSVRCALNYEIQEKSSATTNGKRTDTNTRTVQAWKVKLTALDAKEGSATRAQAEVDPDSVDTVTAGGQDSKKTPCAYAGKSVVLIRHPDETITNDFTGEASDDDVNLINDALTPDEVFFPDTPRAVGDLWDISAKLTKITPLGPKDRLSAQCRLDWVKEIGGKQMGQMSCSQAIVAYQDGNVEVDTTISATMLVDLAAGVIVKCDQKGSSQYSTPATEATQVTGGNEFTFHGEVLDDATTKP